MEKGLAPKWNDRVTVLGFLRDGGMHTADSAVLLLFSFRSSDSELPRECSMANGRATHTGCG